MVNKRIALAQPVLNPNPAKSELEKIEKSLGIYDILNEGEENHKIGE